MFGSIHVYLGPSLDLDTAVKLLPQAHYHPPIECGDIVRILRLEPKKIIIIDGLYETVPAVWHKEILLALELGIEVWGAASIGALRAAELYQYGMRGFGVVFHDYKTGILCDDDEVAVLHQQQEKCFKPINDAMVNIRATCDVAWSKNIITLEEKNKLIDYCKAKYFPYRSLQQSINQLKLENHHVFNQWLLENGMVDVKKSDAIGVLEYHRANSISERVSLKAPVTQFLKELTNYANVTPFKHVMSWLPPIEKKLQKTHKHSPHVYVIIAEIAHFTQKLFSLTCEQTTNIENEVLVSYIKQHSLYSPELDFITYKEHALLSSTYALICQFVCLNHLTTQSIEHHIPVIAHYYGFDQFLTMQCEPMLRKLLVIILATNQHTNKPELMLSEKTLSHYLGKVMHYRKYDTATFKTWYYPTHIDRRLFVNFLVIYVKSAFLMYIDNASARHYFKWIYDAYSLVAEQQVLTASFSRSAQKTTSSLTPIE